jgi:integrase
MASILRRGDSYSVRFKYKDHAGKLCEGWESFKTKKEAQDRKITVEKELLDGTFLIPDAMTVAEMLYKWLPIQSSKHKWAPKTYTHTVAMIQNLVVPYLGKKQIQKVQTYDLEQFYATLSRTPRGLYKQGVKQTLTDKQKRQFLTGASIREVHAMLKTAFSYAVEWGLLLKSPIPREAPKSTSEERAIWDEKTMLAALQTMTDPTLHLAVHLSMILSLRVGEILGLQPGDVDFDAADGRGTITVGRSLQRTEKAALEKTDPNQIYHIFPDQREGSSSALVLKKPKTKKSSRTLYLTKPLKEELLAWLEKLRQDELAMDGRYRNCGQLFRLPNGMPVAPEALSKWYRTWRAEHPEFEKIVFHGLRHSSATYQLIESGGNIKAVQGNTGHATTGILMDTYAHTQDKPRLELAEKLEADFYSQDIGSPKSGSVPIKENLPDSIQITPEGMLKVVRQMNPEQRREFTRLLFA